MDDLAQFVKALFVRYLLHYHIIATLRIKNFFSHNGLFQCLFLMSIGVCYLSDMLFDSLTVTWPLCTNTFHCYNTETENAK